MGDTGPTVGVSARPSTARTVARRERLLLGIAALFVVVGATTLFVGYTEFGVRHFVLVVAPFVATYLVAHIVLCKVLPRRDPFILPIAALLTGLGLLFLGRLARNFLIRQVIWLPLSVVGLLVMVRVGQNLRWLRRYRYTWLVGGLALLAATLLLGVNPSGFGPRLWLGALGLYFQPSELLKLLMIVYLASYLAERRGLIVSEGWTIGRLRLPPLAYVGPIVAVFTLALVILAWQQDLGAATLFFVTFLGMLYLATGKWGYPAAGVLLLGVLGAVGYTYSDLVRLRIDAWWHPWPESSGRAFQVVQSLQAYGAGGILGEGLGLGSPGLIPAVHTDFVHAAIAEELGLAGALAIIGLYAALMYRGFHAGSRVRSSFGQLLASGITVGFIVQAWVIMAGNAKLAPITGVTLPFVSYGGSSLLASCLGLGLLLRISGSISQSNHVLTSPLEPADRIGTRVRLQRVATVVSAALLVLAGTCGYWAILRSSFLEARDDNIRRLLREERIVRGTILDRDGEVLADVEVADDGSVTRRYPVPAAAPALGYASLRYGAAGIEGAFDETLRGDEGRSLWEAWWDDLLHRPAHGADVQLTLDARLQENAQSLLKGAHGAVVLLDAHTGEILVLASSPTYDPGLLDEEWTELAEAFDSPLLNRATQGLFQPGSVFHTVVLAEAIATGKADLSSAPAGLARVVAVNGVQIRCSPASSEPKTLGEAYARGCPGPIVELGIALGPDGLAQAAQRWDLASPPPLEIPAEAAEWDWAAIVGDRRALSAEALGQGVIVLSPLRVALIAATVGADGEMPVPSLMRRTQDRHGRWQIAPPPDDGSRFVIGPEIAAQLIGAWAIQDEGRIRFRAGTAIGGDGKPPHGWYTGVATAPDKVYAVAVLVEHADDELLASSIGVSLLSAALAP